MLRSRTIPGTILSSSPSGLGRLPGLRRRLWRRGDPGSRTQQVRDVVVTVADGRVLMDVVADQEPQADIWGAERRTELFENAFGLPVEIRWTAGQAAAAAG